jgi:hypothetical protein
VADSVDQLLANKPELLNIRSRTMRLAAAVGGGQQPGDGGGLKDPGKQQVLLQFGSERALLWAAEWVERGRAQQRGDGGGDAVGKRTAAEVVAGGNGGLLPGKWLLQLLQGALQGCALASSGAGGAQL